MPTATTREVFVLGRHRDGNRSVIIVEEGSEYTVSASTAVDYANDNAEFPYVI